MKLEVLNNLREEMFILGMAAVILEKSGEYGAALKCLELKGFKSKKWDEVMAELTAELEREQEMLKTCPDDEIPDLNE